MEKNTSYKLSKKFFAKQERLSFDDKYGGIFMFIRDKYVILRREAFGGMAFHSKKGITLELDREGQYLLEILGQPKEIEDLTHEILKTFQRSVPKCEIKKFLDELIEIEFVSKKMKEWDYREYFNSAVYEGNCKANKINCLSAPETVHLTLTKECNLNCSLCYETKEDIYEMPKNEIFTLIDTLSKMKVFQLAIGGGEPFLREDIFEIIEYCQKKSIVPNITTNGTLIDGPLIKRIKYKIGGISVSLNGYSPDTNIGRDIKSFDGAIRGIRRLLDEDIPTGVNVLISRESLPYLEDTLHYLRTLGIKWINVLRLKPSPRNKYLKQYMLSNDNLKFLKNVLDRWNGLLNINVDTALSCIMLTVPPNRLREKAIYGCVAGIRFCTIDCNGDVYPCSFFKDSKYLVGNVLEQDLQEMWLNSNVFKQFREMRGKLKGKCKYCEIQEHCGGCRAIAMVCNNDFFVEDEACIKI